MFDFMVNFSKRRCAFAFLVSLPLVWTLPFAHAAEEAKPVATDPQAVEQAPGEVVPETAPGIAPEIAPEEGAEDLPKDLPKDLELDPESALSAEDLAAVEAISTYFNEMTTLQGKFDQQNQDGSVSSGLFYIRRPGRMRFEYGEPDQLTILADGTWVMLNDRELESVDRYPLRETPLYLILKKHVDLLADALIVRVERQGDLIGVTAREEEGIAQGELTLVFVGPRLELRHWMVEDVQGNRTLVSLRDVSKGAEISHELFVPQEFEFGMNEED